MWDSNSIYNIYLSIIYITKHLLTTAAMLGRMDTEGRRMSAEGNRGEGIILTTVSGGPDLLDNCDSCVLLKLPPF